MRNATVFCTLISMLVLTGATGCQSHNLLGHQLPLSWLQPIEVVSVSGPILSYNPGGPTVEITLKNVGDVPVIALKATLKLERTFEFDFVNVTSANPLLPGESSNETLNLIGPQGGFTGDTLYPLTINLTLQSGAPLVYTKQVQIVEPLTNK